jgi:hypothetical protein
LGFVAVIGSDIDCQRTVDHDSKNRKITMETMIEIVVDSIYAVSFKKNNFFFGGGSG